MKFLSVFFNPVIVELFAGLLYLLEAVSCKAASVF